MTGAVPRALDARGERLAGPIFTGVGLAALAACVVWGPGLRGATLVVVALTAVWVPVLVPLFPRRRRTRARTRSGWRGRGKRACATSGSGWPAKSTTRSPRA